MKRVKYFDRPLFAIMEPNIATPGGVKGHVIGVIDHDGLNPILERQYIFRSGISMHNVYTPGRNLLFGDTVEKSIIRLGI